MTCTPPPRLIRKIFTFIGISLLPNIIWSDVDATGISCQNVNQKKFLDEFTFVFQKEVGSFLQVLRFFKGRLKNIIKSLYFF